MTSKTYEHDGLAWGESPRTSPAFPVLALIVFGMFCWNAHAAEPLPKPGQWEAWILRTRRTEFAKLWPAERPDGKKLGDPLPLWVDCHFSWMMDHPKYRKDTKVPRGIVLRSTPKSCRGQIEEYAGK